MKRTRRTRSPMKNIEEIRRKNLKDNQLFLQKLRINDIRKDLVKSTRKIVPKKKEVIPPEKIDRVTRYSLKVKSGEIPAYIPPDEPKKHGPSKWELMYKDNQNPYQRVFKPRNRQ